MSESGRGYIMYVILIASCLCHIPAISCIISRTQWCWCLISILYKYVIAEKNIFLMTILLTLKSHKNKSHFDIPPFSCAELLLPLVKHNTMEVLLKTLVMNSISYGNAILKKKLKKKILFGSINPRKTILETTNRFYEF